MKIAATFVSAVLLGQASAFRARDTPQGVLSPDDGIDMADMPTVEAEEILDIQTGGQDAGAAFDANEAAAEMRAIQAHAGQESASEAGNDGDYVGLCKGDEGEPFSKDLISQLFSEHHDKSARYIKIGGYGSALRPILCPPGATPFGPLRKKCYMGDRVVNIVRKHWMKYNQDHNLSMLSTLNRELQAMGRAWNYGQVVTKHASGGQGAIYAFKDSKYLSFFSQCDGHYKYVTGCKLDALSGGGASNDMTCRGEYMYDSGNPRVYPLFTNEKCGRIKTWGSEDTRAKHVLLTEEEATWVKSLSKVSTHCTENRKYYKLTDKGPYVNDDYNKQYLDKKAWGYYIETIMKGDISLMTKSKYNGASQTFSSNVADPPTPGQCDSEAMKTPLKYSVAQMLVKRMSPKYYNKEIPTTANLYQQTCNKNGECTEWTKDFARADNWNDDRAEFGTRTSGLTTGTFRIKDENSMFTVYLSGDCDAKKGGSSSLISLTPKIGRSTDPSKVRFECDPNRSFKLPLEMQGYQRCTTASPVNMDYYTQDECYADLTKTCMTAHLTLTGTPDEHSGLYHRYWVDWSADIEAAMEDTNYMTKF